MATELASNLDGLQLDKKRLNRSCDGCRLSKLKCSGTHPCTRCSQKLIDCYYRPRKKRVHNKPVPEQNNTKKTKAVEPSPKQAATDIQATFQNFAESSTFLQPYERRSWMVFFSLYRNYTAGCCWFWFERQLARIKFRLERANKFHLVDLLRQWAAKVNVDLEQVTERGRVCLQHIANNPEHPGKKMHQHGCVHFHVHGDLTPVNSNVQRIYSADDKTRRAMDDIFNPDPNVASARLSFSGKFPEDIAKIQVNSKFEHMFGFSQSAMTRHMDRTGSGLLPWGGDFLALLSPSESDLFAYMQVCAIHLNWSFLKRDDCKFPLLREVPSAHVLPLNTPHNQDAVPFLVRCVHHELIDLNVGINTTITISFEPLQPIQMLPLSLLPLADDTSEASTPSDSTTRASPHTGATSMDSSNDQDYDANGGEDSSETEVFFPDDLLAQEQDELFFQDLLSFARLASDDFSSLLQDGNAH